MNKFTLFFSILLLSLPFYGKTSDPVIANQVISQAASNYQKGYYLKAKTQLDSLSLTVSDQDFILFELLKAKVNLEMGYLQDADNQLDNIGARIPTKHTLYWDAMATKAELLINKKDFVSSARILERLEEEINHGKLSPKWRLRTRMSWSKLAMAQRKYSKVHQVLAKHRAYQDSLNIPSTALYLLTISQQANLALHLGHIKKMKTYLAEGELFMKKNDLSNHNYYAQLLELEGRLCNDLGSPQSALNYLTAAEKIYKENYGQKSRVFQNIQSQIGKVYVSMNDLFHAEQFITETIVFNEKHGLDLDSISSQNYLNLAQVQAKGGNYYQAYILAKKAVELWTQKEQSTSSIQYGEICAYAAKMAMEIGDEKAVRNYLNTSKQIFFEQKAWLPLINIYNQKATLWIDNGQQREAKILLQEAAKIGEIRLKETPIILVDTYQLLGKIALLNDNYTNALRYFYKAKGLQQELGGTRSIAYAKCESLCAQALTKNSHNPLVARKVYRNANALLTQQLEYIYPTLPEGERLEFLAKVKEIVHPFYQYVQENYEAAPDLAIELFELKLQVDGLDKAISRNALFFQQKENNRVDLDLYEDWITTGKQLRTAYLLSKEEQEAQGLYLNVLKRELQLQEKALGWKTVVFAEEKTTYEMVRHQLDKQTAILDFYHFQIGDSTAYGALITRSELEYPKLIPLTSGQELTSFIEKVISTKNIQVFFNNDNQTKFYELIWQPLENTLEGVKKLYIRPVEDLKHLPFATLKSGKKELIEELEIAYGETLFEIVENISTHAKKWENRNMALIGAVSYTVDSQVETEEVIVEEVLGKSDFLLTLELLGKDSTRYEGYFNKSIKAKTVLEHIAEKGQQKKWSTNIYSETAASEDNFKVLTGQNAPRVLHIANQGYYFSSQKVKAENLRTSLLLNNPLSHVGLAFAGANRTWVEARVLPNREDGILTAYELYNLDLQHTELVVLANNQTADKGGWLLARTLKLAGADQILLPLWSVSEEVQTIFLNTFYQNYWSGDSAAEALQKTQQTMKKDYEKADWGAFILVD